MTVRWTKGAAIVAATILGAACSSEGEPAPAVRLELPVRETHRSAILAVTTNGASELHALPIDAEGGITAPYVHGLDDQNTIAVTALLYDSALEELYVEPGPIAIVPDSDASRPLPDADTIERVELELGDQSSAFARLTELPQEIADLRISSPFACADFEVREIPLGTSETVRFILAVGTGVLISTNNAQRFFVTANGAVPLISPPGEMYEGFVAADGAIWIGAQNGEVLRGSLAPRGCETGAEPCERLDAVVRARAMFNTEILSLDGPRTAEPDELYVLSYDGELVRMDFTNDQQRLVYDFADFPHTVRRIGAVAWVRQNEVVAVFDNERAPIRFIDDTVRTEALPIFDDELNRAIHIPNFGSVIGSFSGRIYRNQSGDAEGWIHLGGKPGTDLVLGLVDYEEGFAWAEDAGLVGQWTPGLEYCPAYGPDGGIFERPNDLVRVGRDLVAAGFASPENSPNYVRWLLRR